MKTSLPLSPELEAFLAPHRTPLPLAPSVVSRAIARAAAVDPRGYGGGRLPVRPWWGFAAATGVVLVFGAAAYAARGWLVAPSSQAPAAVPSAWPSRSVPRSVATIPAAPAIEPPPTDAPEGASRRRTPERASTTTVAPTNAELRLLRMARQEVTRGNYGGALAIIGEHGRRFGNGTLAEEREALRVKSLAGIGRHKEAQGAAAAFRARFPHSVFLSTFERMKEADR